MYVLCEDELGMFFVKMSLVCVPGETEFGVLCVKPSLVHSG